MWTLILKFLPRKKILEALPENYRKVVEVGLQIVEAIDTKKERDELFSLAQRVVNNFDTREELQDFLLFVVGTLEDRKITVGEWAQIGSKAGILGKMDD